MPPDLTAPAESSSKPFSLDKLQLSANLYAADIESWIPDTFGPRKSEAQQQAEFNEAIRKAALVGNDTLGLGHPDAGKGRIVGLDNLQRKLGRMEKGKGKASIIEEPQGVVGQDEEAESDTEEESRSRMVGKKKRSAVDLMAPKKKLKMSSTSSLVPLVPKSSDPLLLKPPSIGSQASNAPSSDPLLLQPPSEKSQSFVLDSQAPSSDGHDGDDGPHTPSPDEHFPFSGPISLDSPQAKKILAERLGPRSTSSTPISKSKPSGLVNGHVETAPDIKPGGSIIKFGDGNTESAGKQNTEEEQEDEEETTSGASRANASLGHLGGFGTAATAGMTKNQRKNERKKRAKLRKQQIHSS